MLFASPLSGYLFDNYGPRLPIFIGGLLHVFGLMMTSLSKEYYQFFLSQSVCSGLGTSLIFTPAMTSVSIASRIHARQDRAFTDRNNQ
jgi:MFS family permease